MGGAAGSADRLGAGVSEFPAGLRNHLVVSDALDYLRELPSSSVPMFLFSPPYNLNRRAAGSGTPPGITRGVRVRKLAHSADAAHYSARGGHGKWKNGTAYDGYSDDLPHEAYVTWQQDLLRECWRCLVGDGAIFYVHKPRVRDGVCVTPLDYVPTECLLRQVVMWDRGGGVNMAPTHYMPCHEWIVVLAKPAFRLRSKGASGAGDVWRISAEQNTWHPAPFPLALAMRALETVRPALVVDPFMGSGTTARAASLLGVDYAGCDRNANYVDRACEEIGAAPAGFVRRLGKRAPESLPMFEVN